MTPAASLTFIVRPIPPFRLDLTVWALRRRERNAVDRWDGVTYRRVVTAGGRATEMAVRQAGSPAEPRLIVTATPAPRTRPGRAHLRSVVECTLGARVDLAEWYRLAERNPQLRMLAEQFRGLKPPRFPTIFEALVNAVACQQLSLEVGLELLNRVAVVSGPRRGSASAPHYGFPTARNMAVIEPSKYQAIGFSRQKVRALLALANGVAARVIDPESLSREDDATVCSRLLALRGVGRWSAEYVMLRGLGRLHVFPGDDVGAQKRLARWLGRPAPLDYAGVRAAVAGWQPYAGLVYFHLLLDGLSSAGALESTPDTLWRAPERRTTS
jgi:DNA-3-methyladenine glycosylase II